MKSLRCLVGLHDDYIVARVVGKSRLQSFKEAGLVIERGGLELLDIPVRVKVKCARCNRSFSRVSWEPPAPELP